MGGRRVVQYWKYIFHISLFLRIPHNPHFSASIDIFIEHQKFPPSPGLIQMKLLNKNVLTNVRFQSLLRLLCSLAAHY